MRRIPGRLVGRTVDVDGKHRLRVHAAGARAAHPARKSDLEHLHESGALRADRDDLPRGARRERACATARRSTSRARSVWPSAWPRVPGFSRAFAAPVFNEVGDPRSGGTTAAGVLAAWKRSGILGGVDSGRWYPELADCILMCATELTTDAEIDALAAALPRARARSRGGAMSATENAPLPASMRAIPEPLIFETGAPGRANAYFGTAPPLGELRARRTRARANCRCPTTANSTSSVTSRGFRSGRSRSIAASIRSARAR